MIFARLRIAATATRRLSGLLALTAVVGVGGLLIGAAPVQAERRDTKDDATYTLKRVYKTGDADRYKMTSKVNTEVPGIGPIEAVMTMLMKDTTKEAKEDGSLISISEFESASVNFNGMELEITDKMPKVITTRDKNGKSDVKIDGGDETIIAQMGDQIKQLSSSSGTAMLPTKPVKVGDTWDIPQDPSTPADRKVTTKVTLVSVDTVKGKKIAKLKTVSDITAPMETKLHTESTTLLDLETGKAVSFTTKIDGNSNGAPLKVETTVQMLGPDNKEGTKEVAKPDSAAKPDSTAKKP